MQTCVRRGLAAFSLGATVALAAWGQPTAATQPATTTQPAAPSAMFSRTAEQEIQFQEGLLYYSRNELAKAEADFRSLVESNPADAEAHYYLGLTLLDSKRPAEAVESFNRSLRLDPTPTEVRAARATALIRLKRYDEAREDLKVLEADPRWQSLSAYLRGQLLYSEGDLEGASRAFAQARAMGGEEAVPAEFYEGLTYLRMKDLVRARNAFRQTVAGPDTDPTLGEASRQLDAVLAAQQRRAKPWEIQITTAFEYDSNAILIGSGVSPPSEISDEADTRFVLQPRGSYSFLRNAKLDAGVEGNGYFSWYDDLHDFGVASYQGGPFLTYRLAKSWYFSGRYAYNYVESGHDSYLQRHVFTPQVTWVQPKFGYSSVFYQLQLRNFTDPPSIDPLDRDGQIHALGFVQGINLPEIFPEAGPSNLELSYRYEDQRTDGSDFDGNFHNFGAAFYTPLPFWKLRGDVGVQLSFDRYDNGNSLDSDNDRRKDFEINVVVGLNKELSDWCTARVDYTYTNRESNVETVLNTQPYDFDRHQVGVRLIFSY